MENVNYDITNNCDLIGNGSLHCAPLLMETKKWHSLEDVPLQPHNRKSSVPRGSIRNWLFSILNGNGNYRNSDISLRKAKQPYMDLPSEKESIV